MSDTVAIEVPEVSLDEKRIDLTNTKVPEGFSGDWNDMAKDMALLAKEQAQPAQPELPPSPAAATAPSEQPIAQPQSVAVPEAEKPGIPGDTNTPAIPENQPTPEPSRPEVPDKFKTQDGQLDQEKVLKSYFEAEKALKRLQNKNGQPQQAAIQQPAQVAPPANTQLTPFEIQVAQDLINEAAANGYQMPQGQAIAQARVTVKMWEAEHQARVQATSGKIAQFEEHLNQQAQRQELEVLAKHNPWVLTPQGQAELVKVREENPEINSSPTPWRMAALVLLGQKSMHTQMPNGQVQTTTPTGGQKINPLPATPAQRQTAPLQLKTRQDIEKHLATLTPEQEDEFWQKMGMPKWGIPKNRSGY